MKKYLFFLPILFLCLVTKNVRAQLLYSNTVDVGYFVNPNTTNGIVDIILDDVPISTSSLPAFDTIHVTKVKFGIYRDSAAPAIPSNFSIHW